MAIVGGLVIGPCSECKYFNKPQEEWNYGVTGWVEDGECSRTLSKRSEANDIESLAIAIDSDGWYAGLLVKKTFGCIQWEAKE